MNRQAISQADACRLLGGIDRSTLWRLRSDGQIKFYRIGRRVVYDPQHIDEYLKKRERNLA